MKRITNRLPVKALQSLLLSTFLFNSGVSFAKEVDSLEKPFWLQEEFSGKRGGKTGFVGQSKKWNSSDPASKLSSIDEACKEASHQVAQFFRVRVQSNIKSQLEVTGKQYYSRFEKSADLQSNITLEGISRSDTFTQVNQEGSYLISYCLIELTDGQIQQTRSRLESEQQEIDNLISLTIEQISKHEFERAKLTMVKLKNQSVSDTLVDDLQLLLEEQQKQALSADLTLNKAKFGIGDYLSFAVASNQDAYVYVFLEGFKTTKLLFPSPQSSFNLVVPNEPLKYPLKTQITEGEAFRVPKSKASSYQLRMVAATEPQVMNFLNNSFTGYSVSDEQSYQHYLADCNLSLRCKVMDYEVSLATGKESFEVASYKVLVDGKSSSKEKTKLKKALRKNNITITNQGKKLMVEITVDVAYSERVKADIYIISGDLLQLSDSGEWDSISHARVTGLHDEKKRSPLISKLYDKLIKKAL